MHIKADNISVRYLTGDIQNIGLKDYVIRKVKGIHDRNEFWALKNVSFELKKGDMLGVIGRNGAGKSTMLKVLSGILRPVSGSINVDGNVAALLELGTGFDPDLTVRENTFLLGAMMGYSKAFMKERYDDIIAFAELEEFQGSKFRQLSSGMKSRLGFSVTSMIDPEILLLDEVLAVGDVSFNKKSLKKMTDIIAGGAITVFVSHSMSQVRQMCNKVLWLERGEMRMLGDTDEVVDAYEEMLEQRDLRQAEKLRKVREANGD
jgi:ABC-2 type transport system ATP-binding protein